MVKQLKPKDNKVILENGREISYDVLILATGIGVDYDKVEGLEDAIKDPKSKVYTTEIDNQRKNIGVLAMFEHGEAYFYIPKFPHTAEIESYNFLLNVEHWAKNELIGLVSPKRNITIINANDNFAPHNSELDQLIKNRLTELGVNIHYNTTLKSVNTKDEFLTYEKDGKLETKRFNYLFAHPDHKKNPIYEGTDLCEDGLQINVDRETLQTKNYENIFAVGDCNDLPVPKTLLGGLA